MPRSVSPEAKQFRKELASHLWHMHGEFRNTQNLSLEHLDEIHKMMHVDNYACPPHEHKNVGPYDLGEIKLTLGKKYTDKLAKAVRGDIV
jgi:hypothetical protein